MITEKILKQSSEHDIFCNFRAIFQDENLIPEIFLKQGLFVKDLEIWGDIPSIFTKLIVFRNFIGIRPKLRL